MSAYILDTAELKSMVIAFAKISGSTITEQTDIFQHLHNENIKSVNYRYNEDAPLTSIDLLEYSAMDCYEYSVQSAVDTARSLIYQSCEHREYFASYAFELITRIVSTLISGIDEPDPDKRPIKSHYKGRSICFEIEKKPGDGFIFDGGGLSRDYNDVLIAGFGDSGYFVSNSPDFRTKDKYSAPFTVSKKQADAMIVKAENQQAEQIAAANKAREQKEKERADFDAQITPLIKPEYKAAIIATLDIDDCDIQTDYFNVKSGREILLGFSTHNRSLIPEMRKAIKNSGVDVDDILLLSEKNDNYEHRDGGYYGKNIFLKVGGPYRSGWRIHKVKFYGNPVSCLPMCEIAPNLSDKASECTKTEKTNAGAPTININEEKNGIELMFNTKPEKAILAELKSAGFRWHGKLKIWYAKQTKKTIDLACCLANVSPDFLLSDAAGNA